MPRASSQASSARSSASSRARFQEGLNLSFGSFEFRENIISKEGKKGGGVRELFTQLKKAKREKKRFDSQLESQEGVESRKAVLVDRALTRLSGEKVRDDVTRLGRKLAKRRQKKRKSARDWKKRLEAVNKSVDEAVGKTGGADKKAMMAANRKRRLAQKKSQTSVGRKDKARKEKKMSGAAKRGAEKRKSSSAFSGKKGGSGGGRGGGGGGKGRGGGGRGGGRSGGGGGGRGRGRK